MTVGVAGGVVSMCCSVSVVGELVPAAVVRVADTMIVSVPTKALEVAVYVSVVPFVDLTKSAANAAELSVLPLTLTVTVDPAVTVKPES